MQCKMTFIIELEHHGHIFSEELICCTCQTQQFDNLRLLFARLSDLMHCIMILSSDLESNANTA